MLLRAGCGLAPCCAKMVSLLLTVACCAASSADRPWLDRTDPPAVRAKALLSKMTLVSEGDDAPLSFVSPPNYRLTTFMFTPPPSVPQLSG